MIKIKNKIEQAKMRQSGKILSKIFKKIKFIIKPGINAREIDKFIENEILKNSAIPSFMGFHGYRYASCVSINDEVVHGLPINKEISNNDIVGIDIGVNYQGYHSDAARTYIVGKVTSKIKNLVKFTKIALNSAIKIIKPEIKLSEIQKIIENTAKANNLNIVRELTGHGIGKELQEKPAITNYVDKHYDVTLKEGMTFCLEPMFNIGTEKIRILKDGWTIATVDGKYSCHFEDTILVTKNSYENLTK